ncbi:cocaine- and amphetamine-regulated transcript-like [Sinocyclocheilus anshuiensis]|uniref:Cocaine- and amphetamine-regulated transcript protein-like n=2 Tax=Sinocyclocheilus TaxID=75365 RepID=A0A671LH83_9TELE|nr:PREDICTED: cocaine- and amphetamine-regulated transcript protein-like [Sinocyclocheilus anshuiensis]XP_016350716.1 PREDICTED: cocaine- and amphetamine-regulated transcript protein-like [Sinocyclocheilus anshuiensis]XP_016430764.1 PREDICTED: cocaine- and amphetamine-regulated transcript protein-like [Sinocyclocheilus rhinocerous]XP_016430771.1 PREDICTED: cocaine- and amphetamine-regulated transcript protein-like [Sinocyclocheilus rhinocerous]XP_016430778.1 PREDICTED: cocaine- and amphetamine-
MTSSEILTIVVLFTVLCSGQTSQELTDTQLSQQEMENELVEAMTALLGRYQPHLPSSEKRGIPQCAVGSRCAMRLGPRFGKLCECVRGSNCNSFLLKCI